MGAPQVSYMGFPATTGAPFLPWLVNDAVVAPPELRHCYSEALALMPHCYFVNDYKCVCVGGSYCWAALRTRAWGCCRTATL